jgi:hypothetical protein
MITFYYNPLAELEAAALLYDEKPVVSYLGFLFLTQINLRVP